MSCQVLKRILETFKPIEEQNLNNSLTKTKFVLYCAKFKKENNEKREGLEELS